MRRAISVGLVGISVLGVLIGLMGWVTPNQAQGFATNTPTGVSEEPAPATPAPVIFATNTPAGFVAPENAAPAVDTPSAPVFNYALKQWFEADLLASIYEQIDGLTAGDTDAQQALQVTLYELERRFPGAPTSPAERERLIQAMLSAPRGTVDMRSVVRPWVLDQLNARTGQTEFEVDGFYISSQPALLNSTPPLDSVIRVVYPAEAATGGVQPLFEEFLLALRDGEGGYNLLPTAYDLPAVPYGDVARVAQIRLQDVNRDGLDEAVLLIDDGQINERMLIVAARNNTAVNLVAPGNDLRFGQLLEWDVDNPDNNDPELRVLNYQEESAEPEFPCLSQIEVTWSYGNNYYRPSLDLNASYELQNSLGCTLYTEPLFIMEPNDAIQIVTDALNEYSITAPGAERALMTMAMLYTLNGQIDQARTTAQSVLPAGDPDSTWAGQQATTLIESLNNTATTALDICAELATASPAPACDVDQVLTRFFGLITLDASQDLIPQLNNYGFNIAEVTTVSALGRADRTVIRFDLAGAGWWGFVRTTQGVYRAEPAESPFPEVSTTVEPPILSAPSAAFSALTFSDDPRSALNVIETAERNNPNRIIGMDALYIKALSRDLTGNREAARQDYYTIWSTSPDSAWGKLAADHLERR